MSSLPRTTLALAVAALVSACGGGASTPTAADSFAAQLTPDAARSDRLRAMGKTMTAMASVAISNDQLFQWAQLTYPDLFPGTPTPFANVVYEGKVFSGRAYANGNYLAVANGEAYGLGPFTANALVNFGVVQSYSGEVCSKVNCGSSGGSGSLNICTMPASQALAAGSTYRAVYVSTSFAPTTTTGEYTVEGTVNGPATFEGQPAVLSTNRVFGTQFGQSMDATTRHYARAAANELTLDLGHEFDTAIAGFNLTARTVINPASLNDEFTLQLGASMTKTESSTTTYVSAPFPMPPQTGAFTATYTWEARETITVLGKSYDTCRYKMTSPDSTEVDYSWYIVGKGFTARQEARNAAGTVLNRAELKEGRINGTSL